MKTYKNGWAVCYSARQFSRQPEVGTTRNVSPEIMHGIDRRSDSHPCKIVSLRKRKSEFRRSKPDHEDRVQRSTGTDQSGKLSYLQSQDSQNRQSAPYEKMHETLKEEYNYLKKMADSYKNDGDTEMQASTRITRRTSALPWRR